MIGVFLFVADGESASLRGQVVDAVTGNPVADVNVSVSGSPAGAATNLDGRFVIEGLDEKKEFELVVSRLNYSTLKIRAIAGEALVKITLHPVEITLGEVTVKSGGNIADKTPGAFTAIGSRAVKESNAVAEPPLLALRTPNATFFNWGGHTLGAMHFRLRGFDSNRLTVSVNGIPMNDPEDHTVYWQDTPDFLSNTHDVQIERGVSSFLTAPSGIGGGMNLFTSDVVATRQSELGLFWGGYNTQRRTFQYRSGLVDEKYNFTGRFSKASSDGFRDHSAVDEWSYFLAATRFGANSVHTLNVYGGQEISDLSYTALEQSVLDTNRIWTPEANRDVGWDGERDEFKQPHYILRSKYRFNPHLEYEGSLFWIEGTGFYEQFRSGRDFAEYGLTPYDFIEDSDGDGILDTTTIDETDLIRRKHVDKTQFGWQPRLNWQLTEETSLTAGLELRNYRSEHTNRVMWARSLSGGIQPQHIYNSWDMTKGYLGISGNLTHRMTDDLTFNGGVEVRTISQKVNQDQMGIFHGYSFKRDWTFVNPRVGGTFSLNERTSIYASLAVSGREPFEAQELNPDNPYDTVKTVDPERMTDFELGVRHRLSSLEIGMNFYALFFTDEIVNTGRWDSNIEELELANAPTSRHLGLEVDAVLKTPFEGLKISGDIAFDHSTFGAFQYHYIDEILPDWSPVEQTENVEGNPIPLTPGYVANLRGEYNRGSISGELSLHSVGRQYLDPLGNDKWSLEPYTLMNATLGYRMEAFGGGVKLSFSALNLLDREYNGYGWTETVWPNSDNNGNPQSPLTGRYRAKFIPAMGRMLTAGVTLEF